MVHISIFPCNNLCPWELNNPSILKMSLDLPFKFLLFGRLHIKDLDPSSLMLIIVILELGPTTYGSNVVATFSTRSMFCVVDSRVGDEPNVANPPFPKRNKHKLKFVGFFGGAMDPTNCNRKTNKQQQLQRWFWQTM
jgi:hypothetical protein